MPATLFLLPAQFANGIVGATLHVIEHCGHMPTLEQPAALNRATAGVVAGLNFGLLLLSK